MALESEDLLQKAEKVSGPQNTMKREIILRTGLFTTLDCQLGVESGMRHGAQDWFGCLKRRIF